PRGTGLATLGLATAIGVFATRDFLRHSLVPGSPVDTSVITAAVLVMIGTTFTVWRIPGMVWAGISASRSFVKSRSLAGITSQPLESDERPPSSQKFVSTSTSIGNASLDTGAIPHLRKKPDKVPEIASNNGRRHGNAGPTGKRHRKKRRK